MNFKVRAWALGPITALAVALVVAGCGGGGSGSSDTVTPTSSVYSGPITGFGSVIVNGVRFDTVGATTVDDDGLEVRLEDLRIGMMVTIGGDANDTTGRGTATQLSLSHGTTGAITSIDRTADTLALLGQTVATNATTIFEGVPAFDSLQSGDVIEVYGVLQSDNSLLATLIEKKTGPTDLRLVGRIGNVTATTFTVGNLTVDYAAVRPAPSGLVSGKRVKVKSTATPEGDLLILTSDSEVEVKSGAAYGGTVAANTYLKIKGIAEAEPANGSLTVSGTPVDVSGATFEGGGTIAAGDFIEVKGIWDGSVLKATKVETDDPSDDNRSNELYGAVSTLTGTTIVVHGVTVDVATAVFSTSTGKTLSDLAVGKYVEVKGYMANGVLVATQVELKTNSEASGEDFEDHGVVSNPDLQSLTFTVNGVAVNAANATFESDDSIIATANLAGYLTNGAYVEIKGALNEGVFVATKVEFKGNDD